MDALGRRSWTALLVFGTAGAIGVGVMAKRRLEEWRNLRMVRIQRAETERRHQEELAGLERRHFFDKCRVVAGTLAAVGVYLGARRLQRKWTRWVGDFADERISDDEILPDTRVIMQHDSRA